MAQYRSRLQEELSIIPLGWVIAAGVGLAAVEVLCLVFIPRWAPHDLPPQPWWTLIGVVGAVLLAATILLIGYIYADAKRRGMNAVLWTLLVILIPKPIGFIAYFLLRKPLAQPCPNCKYPVGTDFAFCPKCGYALAPSCPGCGRAVHRDFVCCPYCGKPVATQAPDLSTC